MKKKTLNSQSADSQPLTTTCYVLSGLVEEVEYWAEVRATDGGTGALARITFHTRLDGKYALSTRLSPGQVIRIHTSCDSFFV